MKHLFTIGILLFGLFQMALAQKNVFLVIQHTIGQNDFATDVEGQNDLNYKFKITRLDYYISSIKIIHDGGQELAVKDKYILARAEDNVLELLGNFDIQKVEGIKFSIGVEEPTNNDDPTKWTSPHPLAPQSPSMHWGWSAGYRFVALEGVTGNAFSSVFQLHGLWNKNYFEQTQMVAGQEVENGIFIGLTLDCEKALKGVNLSKNPIEHGVNAGDLKVLQNLRDIAITPIENTSAVADEFNVNGSFSVYPNPSSGDVTVDVTTMTQKPTAIDVINTSGTLVKSIPVLGNITKINVNGKGFYLLRLHNKDGVLFHKSVIIN